MVGFCMRCAKTLSAPEVTAHQGQSIAEGRLRFSIPGAGTQRHGLAGDEPIGILTGDFVFVGDLGRPDLLESAGFQAPTVFSFHTLYAEFVKRYRLLKPMSGMLWKLT